MRTNYHTHTPRCNHASGSEREYIEQAIREGIQILGFSDHSPYFFRGDYVSPSRMRMDQFPEYMETLLALKEEYADRIELHIGFETEYYPETFRELMKEYGKYPVEYMILGQHYFGNEVTKEGTLKPTDSEDRLAQYVAQVTEAMHTGRYTYLAHPDFINYTGSESVYRRHMAEFCRNAKAEGLPLEINLLGIRDHRSYPHHLFFEVAAEVGNEVILGADAHQPEVVYDAPSRAVAEGWVRELGLKLLDTVELRKPGLR